MGIDISATAVEIAKRRVGTIESCARFQTGDVTSAMVYENSEKFDCVLDGLCWHCIIGSDRNALLGYILNVLKPNGCFLVMTMCNDPRGPKLSAHFDPQSRCITNGRIAERYLGWPEDLRAELAAASFEVTYQRLVDGNSRSGDQDMFLAVVRARK